MNTELNRIPTREDITRVLKRVGKPGEKRDKKQAAVRELFEKSNYRGVNSQGHHIADDLEDYEAY